MDIVEPATRSRMMAAIRGRDTKPEMVVRKRLHAAGFRYRLHDKRLPGKPDIVLPRWRAVVLIHGCFWHRHPGCRFATSPASNPEFWQRKFDANVGRDQRVESQLGSLGWRVAVVWECQIKSGKARETIARLADWLKSPSGDRFELSIEEAP
jgi:DNA mismatch endonuclease, patch repair protein